MDNIILVSLFAAFAVFSSISYAMSLSDEKYSFMETLTTVISEDNRTVRFLTGYSQNSTGLLTLIPDADCRIIFSTNPLEQTKMNFIKDSGYYYAAVFNESGKVGYTITCSNPAYQPKSQTGQIQLFINFMEIVLIEPKEVVNNRTVNFLCEARGNKPTSINFYTDTSGEWKLRASTEIKGSKSPYRVNFREQNVADGNYKWTCEAETGKSIIAPVGNQSFRVKFSVNCTESLDCSSWLPSDCPSSAIQNRVCNNTEFCRYEKSRSCTHISEANISGIEPPIQTLGPEETGSQNQQGKSGGSGINILLVVLIIVIIGAGGFALIKLRAKRKRGVEKDEDIFGEEDFEEEPEEGGEGTKKGDDEYNDDTEDK